MTNIHQNQNSFLSRRVSRLRIIGPAVSFLAFWLHLSLASCALLQSGPPLGSSLPLFKGTNSANRRVSIHPSEAPCILFFYSASCYPCSRLLEVITTCLEQSGRSKPRLFLLIQADQEATGYAPTDSEFPVVAVTSRTWKTVFHAKRTPMLLFYDAKGTLIRKQLGWRPQILQQRILENFSRRTRINTMLLRGVPCSKPHIFQSERRL